MEATVIIIQTLLIVSLLASLIVYIVYAQRKQQKLQKQIKTGLILKYKTKDKELNEILKKVQVIINEVQPVACEVIGMSMNIWSKQLVSATKYRNKRECGELIDWSNIYINQLKTYKRNHPDKLKYKLLTPKIINMINTLIKEIIIIKCKDEYISTKDITKLIDDISLAFCNKNMNKN